MPPSTEVVCLGILINTVERATSIPPEKFLEIKICVMSGNIKNLVLRHNFSRYWAHFFTLQSVFTLQDFFLIECFRFLEIILIYLVFH